LIVAIFDFVSVKTLINVSARLLQNVNRPLSSQNSVKADSQVVEIFGVLTHGAFCGAAFTRPE
jgi:hypothetical protein